jgi:hypothetical protein
MVRLVHTAAQLFDRPTDRTNFVQYILILEKREMALDPLAGVMGEGRGHVRGRCIYIYRSTCFQDDNIVPYATSFSATVAVGTT